jgi:two-component system response regulator HydG
VILLSGDFISEKELPLSISQCVDVQPDRQCSQPIQPLELVEKQAILAALEQTAGNKTEAAKQLGITRKTLLAKLQK